MATKISGMTAITAGAYDDTALSERVNNAGVTRKATVAQDRVALLIANAITAGMIAAGTIVNADINAAAAIVDTKLATISTAGKVSNSATTATSANTASAIVARDASGNFSAGVITAGAGNSAFVVDSRLKIGASGDGLMTMSNLAASAGVGFDLTTDVVLKVRNRAQNAYATLDALAYRVSGAQVVGAQGAAVADAAGGAIIDAEARTALNAWLARARTHGLIAA